jgi:Inner membrane protein CreD
MGRKALAIIAIFLCTTFAWIILGASIENRTKQSGSDLGPRVESSWGAPQQQAPPFVFTTAQPHTALSLERSRVSVDFDLEQRQKGLLWFPTYRVAYRGDYLFRNTTTFSEITLRLAFPASDAVYDDLVFRVDGQPVPVTTSHGGAIAIVSRPAGAQLRVEVGYRSQGMGSWCYFFGDNVSQVRDFVLDMRTDFARIDFPQGALSPTMKRRSGDGWMLTWRYANLVTGSKIGMTMPERIQPGPMAGRISFFAPVSLLFFFFLMFIITTIRKIALHPMHYFFLATSFFAFHLLLAYLVDHLSIHLAFVICSAVSIFLVVSYLRIVTGPRFAWVGAATSQFVYLVLFSYAFFLPGFTGLAITIGAIVTLFVVMQMTARIDWGSQQSAEA